MAGETKVETTDDFEAAFAQIADADAKGTEVKIEPQVEKTAEQIEAERVAAEAAAAEKTAADAAAAANAGKTPEQIEAEATAAEEAAAKKAADDAAAAAAQVAAAADERLAATVAKAVSQTNAEAAAAEAERQRAAAAAAKEPPALLTAEEMAVVRKFEEEFPDIAKAQMIQRRAEYKQIVGHTLDQVQKYVGEQIEPLAKLLANLAERTHVGDLQKEVPNYDKLDVATLAAWVKTQPAYIRTGMDEVMRSGSATDVKDLVTRFYKETGTTPPAATPAAKTPEETAAAAAVDAKTKKAVAALAPVVTKRSSVAAAAEPADFDGAFAAAARELEGIDGGRFTR
jgi:hypothetical protein